MWPADFFPKGRTRKILYIFFLTIPVLLLNCKTASDVYSPKEWRDLLENAGGWKPLPFPDSKYRPGSIIQVNAEGIRWIDHLDSCGCPSDVLDPEKSYIPGIQFSKSNQFGADAMVRFKGISAGPSFDKLSKVRMELNDHGADALRFIKLLGWLELPENQKTAEACLNELSKPDRFLVTEAFRISKGKYSLYDKNGAEIKLKMPVLDQFLRFQPDVKYELTADGALTIDQPAYIAVRMAIRLAGDWRYLKSPSNVTETADKKIDELYLKQAEE